MAAYCLDSSDYSFQFAAHLRPWLRAALTNTKVVQKYPASKLHNFTRSVSFSPNGERAAVCLGRGVLILDIKTGDSHMFLYNTIRDINALLSPEDDYEQQGVVRAEFLWASSRILLINDRISVKLYDASTNGTLSLAFADQDKPFIAMSASACGRYFATATGWADLATARLAYRPNILGRGLSVSIWDLHTRGECDRFQFSPDVDEAIKLLVCTSGQQVAVERDNGAVQLFSKLTPGTELGNNNGWLPCCYLDRQGRLCTRRGTQEAPQGKRRLDAPGIRLWIGGDTVDAIRVETGERAWSQRLESEPSMSKDLSALHEQGDGCWIVRDVATGVAVSAITKAVHPDSIHLNLDATAALGVEYGADRSLTIWSSHSRSSVALLRGDGAETRARARLEQNTKATSPFQGAPTYTRAAFTTDGGWGEGETEMEVDGEPVFLVAFNDDERVVIMEPDQLRLVLSPGRRFIQGSISPDGVLFALVEDVERVILIDLALRECVGWLDLRDFMPRDAIMDIKVTWDGGGTLISVEYDKLAKVFDVSTFKCGGADLLMKLTEEGDRIGIVMPEDAAVTFLTDRVGRNLFHELAAVRQQHQPNES